MQRSKVRETEKMKNPSEEVKLKNDDESVEKGRPPTFGSRIKCDIPSDFSDFFVFF